MDSILVTGANGEVGHVLIPELAKNKEAAIIALDIQELDDSIKPFVHEVVVADINDKTIIEGIISKHKITTVFHMAGLLSTSAEKDPERAHKVNVEGTALLLSEVMSVIQKERRPIKFVFASTIAVYGLPDTKTKMEASAVSEDEYLKPMTVYGINKLYCENLGEYYSKNYKLLDSAVERLLDFRCVRFPGLISALTVPTGGTSDYGAEMIHTAAQGENYESFVREDTILPFMVMPDAIKALIQIANADKNKLSKSVYNVNSFSINAKEIADIVLKVFPDTAIDYNPNPQRQKIVDSWPAGIDDSLARKDWGWSPDYDVNKAFNEYLIPEIQNKYKK
jgi:threonine 3-dehydrogenase